MSSRRFTPDAQRLVDVLMLQLSLERYLYQVTEAVLERPDELSKCWANPSGHDSIFCPLRTRPGRVLSLLEHMSPGWEALPLQLGLPPLHLHQHVPAALLGSVKAIHSRPALHLRVVARNDLHRIVADVPMLVGCVVPLHVIAAAPATYVLTYHQSP
jgi:hypothetical protein